MAKDDLMEHATSTVDFYELLNVKFETSESDIRRAYRKTALKYHPDKLGKDFDPEKFHLLQIANDVLSDPAAKAAYDNARNARLQKVRQNELFEGKRRQMKDDLEARERGAPGPGLDANGLKRPREEDEMEKEIRRLAEEGKRRRMEKERQVRAHTDSAPSTPEVRIPRPPSPQAPPQSAPAMTTREDQEEEDQIAELERRIREAEEAKARRKAEKKARKSGVYMAMDSPRAEPVDRAAQATSTPIKRPDLSGIKADEKSSASPKFSFSPRAPAAASGGGDEFAATMARLKEAERQRLEAEIRKQEAEEAA